MRIWDINPGYLNRQSLLGEHRELHAIVSVITNNKKGYSNHPETLRWKGHGRALTLRHDLLVAEMSLRGFRHKSPLPPPPETGEWPVKYIDEPYRQFSLLENKYKHKEQGRISLPRNARQLWHQHRYSVLARNPDIYEAISSAVSRMKKNENFSDLANELTEILRQQPSSRGIRNALQHMQRHMSDFSLPDGRASESLSLKTLLMNIQQRTMADNASYLTASTALSELDVWI
ncbi:Glycosylase domain-containing protein, DUF1722 [Desulfonema magnum]|uniref:Glycosylase domain-containing protein, DUF1722 n=2 Tax=Desulfonema magnum TaxID=45655 RepID=A0A975GNP0_9BACT|nr:Glycosylase domain-containing protein, DUF1722 [Desulfonema magnum]